MNARQVLRVLSRGILLGGGLCSIGHASECANPAMTNRYEVQRAELRSIGA